MAVVRKWVLVIALMAMVGSLIGCNTMRGAGRDIERAGEEIGDVAD